MNDQNSFLSKLPFVVAFSAFMFLVACGESTNLNDPKEIVSTTECSDLESVDGVSCVSGRFVDDAVVNVNYSCGKVNAVTDVAGGFSCPAGSTVEFSLLNPDDTSSTAKKIVFGKVLVKNLPKRYSSESFLYVTPKDFGDIYATNIVRLLQSLRAPDTIDDYMPNRKIVLLDEDKKKLTSLNASISSNDFALSTSDFDSLVSSYVVTALNRTMIDSARADAFLKKAIHSTVGGSYYVPGYAVTLGYRPGTVGWDGDYGGIRGISLTDYFLAATWNLVDRKGRVTGFGVYSTGPASAPSGSQIDYDQCKLLLPTTCVNQPSRNILRMIPDAGLSWSNWIADGSWRLSYNLTDAGGVTLPGNKFMFTQGKIDRGAIAGSEFLYKQIYDETWEGSTAELGQWKLIGSPDFSTPTDTSFTVTRLRSIAPTLDPSLWDITKINFPLNVKAVFLQSDGVTQIATLRFTILKDGNIVSNLHDKCGIGLDLDTLKYSDGDQEFPLGTIAQIFTASNPSTYMAPMLIIPDDPLFSGLRNIQIGSAGASGNVRLRVDKANPSAYLKLYNDTAFSDGSIASDVDKSAVWADAVTFLQSGAAGASGISGYITSQEDFCP